MFTESLVCGRLSTPVVRSSRNPVRRLVCPLTGVGTGAQRSLCPRSHLCQSLVPSAHTREPLAPKPFQPSNSESAGISEVTFGSDLTASSFFFFFLDGGWGGYLRPRKGAA